MMRSQNAVLIPALLALMWPASAAFGQATHPLTSSAESSPGSGTRVPNDGERLVQVIGACSAAADDLAATRKLAEALESENKILAERLETEKRATHLLAELNSTRKAESDALRATLAAKNEAIGAKDAVIAEQDKLIAMLKQKRTSPWRRIGDILVGAAIAALIK